MYGRNKDFILLLCVMSSAAVDLELRSCLRPNNTSISTVLEEECPVNSQCLPVNSTFKCICQPNFQHNVIPNSLSNLEHASYCLLKNSSESPSAPLIENESKNIFYMRSPAKAEHLVYVILLVLLAVILTVAVIYVVKLLKPLKRTKVAYVQLKRRNSKHHRLVEEEVYDSIAMTRPKEDALLCY